MKRRVSGLVVLLVLAQTLGTRGFPDSLNIGLAEPITNLQSWVRKNRSSHWLFEFILNPFISVVEFGIESVESVFTWLPWFVPAIIVFVVVARTRRWGVATFAALAVVYPGLVGVWSESIVTISLMAVAVFICVLIGVPLGVLAALKPRVEAALRPILDGMQTVPATVYLIPIVLFFGIGPAPAAIATVIYALPPMVRLTTLGIQQVPKSAVVGPKADEKLKGFGIHTIGDLAARELHWLVENFGKSYGAWLHEAAWGRDDRPVETESEPESMSRETTFERDLHAVRDRAELGAVFTRLCEQVAADLQRKGYEGKTIGIKLRYDNFQAVTRDQSIDGYTADAKRIRQLAGQCLKRVDLSRRIRLLGVRVGSLVKAGTAPDVVSHPMKAEEPGHEWQTQLLFTED